MDELASGDGGAGYGGVAGFEVAEEAIADVDDVLLHGELGGRDVFLGESLVDAFVSYRGRSGRELVGLVATEEGFLLHVLEDAAEFAVAGGFGEDAVEAKVLFDVGEAIAADEDLFGALDAVGEVAEDVGGDVGSGDGVEFEDDAEVVEVGDLFGGKVADGGAAAGLDADETFGFETVESFADGGFADAQLVGEELFGEAERGLEATGQHALFDAQIGHLR